MTRISENQSSNTLLAHILRNKNAVDRYGQEVSTGLKVSVPGESRLSGTITQYQDTLNRVESYRNRITTVQSFLEFQDDILRQANDLLIRANEVATQGANETLGPVERESLSEEVFQLRDHLVTLANAKYQGKFVFGGADDDDPPYDAGTYTEPLTGGAATRYIFDATDTGQTTTRDVRISDDLSVTVNTPANAVFGDAIEGLERLGRALAGYRTLPDSGTPTGAGTAYTQPTDFAEQTEDIRGAIDIITSARDTDIVRERVSLGGRLQRLEIASSLLDVSKNNAEDVINDLQNADTTTSITNLTQAQNALQASLAVSARVLQTSILDYI